MIGTAIKTRMKELHITQAKLATAAGISQGALSNIINGNSLPKEQTAEALARALEVPLAELLAEKAEPQSLVCYRCGSSAVMEFHNHASGAVRLTCGFCGLDTGEQRDRSQALRLFESYASKPSPKKTTVDMDTVHVLSVGELLDSTAFDDDDVRPVWFENRGLFFVPALLQCGIAERERDCVRMLWFKSFGMKTYDINRYGKDWRCWSGKPSLAVSDSVEWIDS